MNFLKYYLVICCLYVIHASNILFPWPNFISYHSLLSVLCFREFHEAPQLTLFKLETLYHSHSVLSLIPFFKTLHVSPSSELYNLFNYTVILKQINICSQFCILLTCKTVEVAFLYSPQVPSIGLDSQSKVNVYLLNIYLHNVPVTRVHTFSLNPSYVKGVLNNKNSTKYI